MEQDEEGREGVRVNLREEDLPLIAAMLTPAIHEQRSRFMAEHDRLPDEGELRILQNGVLNDWYRMIARLQEDHRRAQGG